MEETVICKVRLKETHSFESGSKRIIFGKESTQRPFELKIIQFEGDSGYYLIEYNVNGEEIIDTFHDNIEGAMRQAKYDWNIDEADWQQVR